MISWIQTTFQKHIKLVMLLLLLAVIVPFVFTIGQMPGLGQGDRKVKTVELFGVPFTSDAERQAFYEDAQISFFLAYGQAYADPTRMQAHAFQRGAALQLADQFGIPGPKPEQVTEFIQTLPAFFSENGTFDHQAYTRFRDEMASNPQLSVAQVTRIMHDDWRIAQVGRIVGGPGYVLASEVEQALARVDTKWSVETATLDLTTVSAPAEPGDEELRTWFDANTARYRIPERVKVSYVEFRGSDQVSRVELKDEDIVRFFEQNKSRYTPPPPTVAEGETPPPPAEIQLADVRDRVVQDLTTARARSLAAKAAADFAYVLFDRSIARGTEAFDQLVEAQKLAVKSPPAFAANQPPPGTGWSAQVVSQAFQLSEKRVVSDPLTVGDNTFVLFFEERIPSSDADFFAVRDRVLADVRENQRRDAITARGKDLQVQLAAAVKSGKSFSAAATELKLETKKWEDFTLRQRPDDIDYGVLGRLEELAVNDVSPMAVQGDRGMIMVVTKRQAPDLLAAGAALDEARTSLMRQSALLTQQGLIGAIVDRELKKSGLATDSE